VHVIEEEESSGAAAEIQVSEPINIAGASVEQEVDEVVVVVISEDHVVAPWGHHEDPLGTPEAGPQQLADAVVASILRSHHRHRFRDAKERRIMIRLGPEHIVGASGLWTGVERLHQLGWLRTRRTWWCFDGGHSHRGLALLSLALAFALLSHGCGGG